MLVIQSTPLDSAGASRGCRILAMGRIKRPVLPCFAAIRTQRLGSDSHLDWSQGAPVKHTQMGLSGLVSWTALMAGRFRPKKNLRKSEPSRPRCLELLLWPFGQWTRTTFLQKQPSAFRMTTSGLRVLGVEHLVTPSCFIQDCFGPLLEHSDSTCLTAAKIYFSKSIG